MAWSRKIGVLDSPSPSTSPIVLPPSQSPSQLFSSIKKVSMPKPKRLVKNKTFIGGIIFGVVVLLAIVIFLCMCRCCGKRRKKKKQDKEQELYNPTKPHKKTKSKEEVRRAPSNEKQQPNRKAPSNEKQQANQKTTSNEKQQANQKTTSSEKQQAHKSTPPSGQQANRNTPSSEQQANWSNPSNAQQTSGSNPSNRQQFVKETPQSAQFDSEQWSAVPPPPPPQMMSSADMSTAGFSSYLNHPQMPPPPPSLSLGFNKSTFTYEDLSAATEGFSKNNLLGQGGFGYVHKGVLPNGKEIAVKSLKSGSGQGEREFQAEVEIISRVHHRHLVSLVGYCIAEKQRMLVYEFVPNGSLEHHLYGRGVPVMDFGNRLKIALGSAKGFAYLHEDCHPRIIHRDIKAANILLECNFDAKVADFGLAKLSNDEFTHVSTRIMGTFGYLAPEYASSGKLTDKSDVYSYGIVLLELITGRRPVDIHSNAECLIDWARPILARASQGGSYEELVDPRLRHNYNPQEMLRMVACAGACIRHSARRRPKMSQIVRALEGDSSLEDLNVVAKHESGSDQEASSNSEIQRFRKTAFSDGFSSSDYGVTEEYGHTPSSSDDSAEFRLQAKRRGNR